MGNQNWETPWELLNKVNRKHWFTVDAAAEKYNSKCEEFFTGPCTGGSDCTCGLCSDWSEHTVWCNPPYENILPWVEKAIGQDAVLLLPSDTSTQWFARVWDTAFCISFLVPRVNFEGTITGNNKGSILAYWLPAPRPLFAPTVKLWHWQRDPYPWA